MPHRVIRRLRFRKPSPAMVIAFVSLLVALGGTSYAAFGPFKGDKIIARHSLSGNRLRNHTITASQVNLNQLGSVPNAISASHASTADSATHATTADTVALGALQSLTPNTGAGWNGTPGFGATAPAWYQDGSGLIHLQGAFGHAAACGTPSTLATLPSAAAPTRDIYTIVHTYIGTYSDLNIHPDGTINLIPNGTTNCTFLSVEGITYRR